MKTIKIVMGVFLLIFFLSSCEELLEVPDISNESVELLAPSESTIVTDSIINFSWNEVFEATQYQVQVAAPNFENAAQIVIDTTIVIDSTFTGTRIIKSLVNSGYEWRVKAINSGFETEFSSNKFEVNASSN